MTTSILLTVVVALLVALLVVLRVVLTFWWNFAHKQCPLCASKRSRFLGYERHQSTATVYSAHRCKSCKTDFVAVDGATRMRHPGPWSDSPFWDK